VYRFKLQALNYNGAGPASAVFEANACQPPSGQGAPFRLATSVTTITVGWLAPLDDGGCPITGFALYRDAADGATPTTEVNSSPEAAL
jgi:hypothetical protein